MPASEFKCEYIIIIIVLTTIRPSNVLCNL